MKSFFMFDICDILVFAKIREQICLKKCVLKNKDATFN